MKTVVRITNDYQSDNAYQSWREDIKDLLNETDLMVSCSIANTRMRNTVEELKDYQTFEGDFEKTTTVQATGYVQAEWQTYTIKHNEEDDDANLAELVSLLKKTFTHKNDYSVEIFERAEIDGKNFDADPHEHQSFSITHIEFPDKDDVKKAYVEIYGEDFDEIEVNIN